MGKNNRRISTFHSTGGAVCFIVPFIFVNIVHLYKVYRLIIIIIIKTTCYGVTQPVLSRACGKYRKVTKTTENNRKLTENYRNQPKST